MSITLDEYLDKVVKNHMSRSYLSLKVDIQSPVDRVKDSRVSDSAGCMTGRDYSGLSLHPLARRHFAPALSRA